MDRFVGAILVEIGKYLVEPIKSQCKYLCCYNTNIQNLEAEATKLGNAKVGVDGQVEAARSNAEMILPTVEAWLQNVSMIQDERREIESEIRDVKSGCLAIKSRFLLGRKATKMAAAMKVLLDDGKFERIANPALPAAVALVPLGQTYELESRKHFEENIMESLREKKVKMMGISGMGGVGKTTMAKNIMRRARGESLFSEIVMVVVSQPVDTSRIQKDMAELLGLDLKVDNISARAHLLRTRLMNSKSILIILDDLWKGLNLEDLGISDEKECVILLTSRNTDVFSAMSVEKTFQMKILEDKEAWSLFEEKVGACANDPTLIPTAQEIVRECKGLPIALVTVGSALKDKKNEAIWKNAQRELKSGYPEGISDFLADVYNPLKLSYDLLEDEQAKSIFLLCCVFSEVYYIPLYFLSLYAWGLGMFERITHLQDARNKVQATIETLKSRSLLLDCWDETLTRMHDVVRDVGNFIAGQKKLIDHNFDCTMISISGQFPKIMFPGGSGFPNLRLLLILNPIEAGEELPFCDNFFERAVELNVLHIGGYLMKSLPNKIQLLRKLRTLILTLCPSLEDISIVGELASLEILYCCGLSIKELPVEIGRLSHLKLLRIQDCMSLTIAAGVISGMIGLEELTIYNFSGWEWGASEGKNARLCELNSLSSLTTLRIHIQDASLAAEQIYLPDLVEFDITIGNWISKATSYGKQMWLELEKEVFIQGWIHQLLWTTEHLYLEGEGSSKLVPHLPEFQSLKNLEFRNAEMTRLIDGRSCGATTVFPLLETLYLNHIKDLECLWDEVPLFCNLSSIEIINCDRLCSLFLWTTGNDHLPQLKSIDIRSCSMLEQVVDVGSRSRNHRHFTFPKLYTLELHDLPRLTSICKGIDNIEFPALTWIFINQCPNLKSLVSSTDDYSSHFFCKTDQAAFGRQESSVSFTRLGSLSLINCGFLSISLSIASNLVHLRELVIDSCGEMVNVMEDKVDEVEIRCPFNNLEQLKLTHLPKLKAFCDWRCAPELPSLRRLYISKCPLMEILSFVSTTSPISSYSFENLESIEIMDCSMLEEVVLWNEEVNGQDMNGRRITFPKLETLHLQFLPRLKSFCKGIQSIEFPLFTQMVITKCLESLKVAFGRLEKLAIEGNDNITIKSLYSPSTDENLRDLTNERVSLWCDQISMDFFTRLVDLTVSKCGNIKSLFSPTIANNLVNLISIKIMSCSMLEQVVLWNEEENGQSSCHITFPKLETLYVYDLPRLTSFCKGIQSIEFPLLTWMDIVECPNMKSLVSTMENDFKKCSDDDSLHWFCKPDEAALGRLKRLAIDGYECISRPQSLWCDQIPIDFFTRLVYLTVYNCGNMKSMFSASIAGNLVNLRELTIKSCGEMVKVIEDEEALQSSPFTKLEHLCLFKLPKLKTFCDWRCALHLPSLRHVSISDCPEMERFSFGSLTTSKLEVIYMNNKRTSNYFKDLNDTLFWDRYSLHLEILFGSD